MAAKKAKGKGGAGRSNLDGTDPIARLTALRAQLAGLLDRLVAAEKSLADALRERNGTAPATRKRTTAAPRRTTGTRKRTTTPATRTRRSAPRSGG